MAPHVVILGGGPAGVALAQKLLTTTLPKVDGMKITLVSPSTHLYWNPSTARALAGTTGGDSALFSDIRQRFRSYNSSEFEFVVGKATSVDTKGSTVTIEGPTDDSSSRTVSYDELVVATGTRAPDDLPLKTLGSHEETQSSWDDLRARIKAARSVTVAGAGPTGIELAGFLAERYGRDKTIGIVLGGERALPDLKPSVGKSAEKKLEKLGVAIIRNAKVVDHDAGTVYLSTHKSFPTDVYLPATGLLPNTAFLPSSVLDARKHVRLDRTLRAHGHDNIWAVGDVGDLEGNRVARVEPQVLHLAANLDAVLTGSEAGVRPFEASRGQKIFVPIGDSTGTGQWGSFRLFSFLGGFVKDKAMFETLRNPPPSR